MKKVLSLCDGIGGGMMAFAMLGKNVDYHAVEIDENCRKLADKNYKIKRWSHNVTDITEQDIKENGPYDFVMFGSPCQSVSVSGTRKGLKGQSGLLYDCVKILRWAQKYNPELKFIIENVKMQGSFLKEFNEIIGCEPYLINSKAFVPQNRNRYYWTNFNLLELPKNEPFTYGSLGVSVYGWSKSTRYIDKKGKIYSKPGPGRTPYIEQRFNDSTLANTLNTGNGCSNQSTCNFVFKNHRGKSSPGALFYPIENMSEAFYQATQKRFKTPRENLYYRYLEPFECAKLQGFPETFKLYEKEFSKSFLYKAIGNGWTIPVIAHLIKSALKS